MRLTTKTEYGLICLIYLARHTELHPITLKEIVKGEKYSFPFAEKILQKLRAANIVTSQQGSHGGWTLARDPSAITLKDVIEALEGKTFEVFCEPEIRKEIVCTHYPLCDVKPVWQRTKDLLDGFFGSITLAKLAHQEAASVSPKVTVTKRDGDAKEGENGREDH